MQNNPTDAERLVRMSTDPVYFAQQAGTDFDPRPSQCRLLRAPLENLISITSKRRQIGASETMAHWVAWSLFAKPRGWKAYIVAPNEFVGNENLERIYNIFDCTPLLKDNLNHCVKNATEFRLTKLNKKVELLLVGESGGNARRGISIKNGNGLIWWEELEDVPKARDAMNSLNAATAWGGGVFYCGTKRGFSGPFYDKYQYISRQIESGREGYAIFKFPLIEYIAERHQGKGIKLQWLRDRKAEVEEHVWKREYLGLFAEASNTWFNEDDVRAAWQTYDRDKITWKKNLRLICGIDWGMTDATAIIFAQDNPIEDRLEVVHVTTMREKKHCKDGDIPIKSFDDVVKFVCNMRDRGYDPQVIYSDKNNRGGIFSDRLVNEHGFNVVDASWNSNTVKTQCLRSLRNLIQDGRFIFPADPRILTELARFSPVEDDDTGKYRFTRHHSDVIASLAMMSEYMAREEQEPIFSCSVGQAIQDWKGERSGDLLTASVY